MPGPKPKPTSLKVLQGNPGQRTLPANEPIPLPIEARKPDFGADDRASRYWDETLPVLRGMGLGTEADGGLLKLYCLHMGTIDRASDALAEMDDWTYETCNKSEAPVAWLKIRDVASKAAESLSARLGLSPADRSRINVKRPDDRKKKLASVQARTQRGAGAGGS
jgi:phage terminase small subunit